MGSEASQPRYFFFCSSVPPRRMGVKPRVLAVMLVWMPVQPQASSSVMRMLSISLMPAPPYSVGSVGFTRPSFQASFRTSIGKTDSWSHFAATGAMRSRAKRLHMSTRATCSSESSKSII